MAFLRREALPLIALVVAGFSLYAFDLGNGFILDDDVLILQNSSVQSISIPNISQWFTQSFFSGAGLIVNYYRPLPLASFALTYFFVGEHPLLYHLINNLLHIANALLVYVLVLYLFRRQWLAFLTALIFVVHPMQSENVAYIAGICDLLSSFFMLTALLAWLKGVEKGRSLLIYGVSGAALVLALLSRENAIIFPGLAATAYLALYAGKPFFITLFQSLRLLWLHITIVAGYLALRLTVLNFDDFLNFGQLQPTLLYSSDISVRLYTFMPVLAEYLRTFFWPTNVHERFLFFASTSFFEWRVWPVTLGIALVVAVLVYLGRRARRDERVVPHYSIWLFSLFWFFACLVPSSGIIPTNYVIQDHRLYLAMIGLSVLGLYYIGEWVAYERSRGFAAIVPLALVLGGAYLVFLSSITIERAIIWGKPVELFEETLRYEPLAPDAHNALGVLSLNRGEYTKAKEHFLAAIATGVPLFFAYHNLGNIYVIEGDAKSAIPHYEHALEIRPNYVPSLHRLSVLYLQQKSPKAIEYLKRLNALVPYDPNVYYNLALALQRTGEEIEALHWATQGRRLVQDGSPAAASFEELITSLSR